MCATFGLAIVKREGSIVHVETGKEVSAEEAGLYKPSETRWIEMCYDPGEDISHIDLEPFREVFQTQQMLNNYTDEDIYLIIKSIANEFIDENGG